MQDKKRTRRINTVQTEPTHRITQGLHHGMNYFVDLNFSHLKTRRSVASKTLRSNSLIQGTPIYETLRQNKFRLDRIKTEVNQMREVELNDYLKKSIRYQQLLNINDNKKKRLATLNAKVGAVIKKSNNDIFQKQIIYRLRINTEKIEGWKPESREGHSAIVNLNKDQLILVGGHCSAPFSIIHIFSFTQNLWVKQIISEIPRSYHSTTMYKNRFAIIFGGMGVYNKSRKTRDCYNSITLFDLMNYSCRNLKMHNQQSVEPRRSHSAVLLGKFMLVLGGINNKKQYLNDFLYLDLKQLRWYHKEYKVDGKELQQFLQYGIAKHCAYSTFKPRKSYSFFSSDYEESQCVYFIGGFNEKQQSNIIFQLVLNKYVPTFKRVEYSGNPPSPVNPIIEKYNQHSDILVIISGEIGQREMTLFRMKDKHFIYINNHFSITPLGGYGSSLNYYNGEYYLFFGLGEEGYMGELTKFSIEEQTKESEKKKKLNYTKNEFQKELSQDSSNDLDKIEHDFH